MLYSAYQAQEDLLAPWRMLAVAAGELMDTIRKMNGEAEEFVQ